VSHSHSGDEKLRSELEAYWMQEALAEARQAALHDEVPVGAIVVFEGAIISRAFNLRETNQSPIAHAEILALEQAAKVLGTWRLQDCVLIVTLEPCPMCLAACQQARVSEVLYGAADPKGGAISLGYRLHEDKRTNHRFEAHLRAHSECGAILTEFFGRKRKK